MAKWKVIALIEDGVCKTKVTNQLNTVNYCKDIQPFDLQFLTENIERFFCNFDERGSADTELTEGSAVVADYQNAGCTTFLIQLPK